MYAMSNVCNGMGEIMTTRSSFEPGLPESLQSGALPNERRYLNRSDRYMCPCIISTVMTYPDRVQIQRSVQRKIQTFKKFTKIVANFTIKYFLSHGPPTPMSLPNTSELSIRTPYPFGGKVWRFKLSNIPITLVI